MHAWGLSEAIRQQTGMLVIFRQPFDHGLKRDDCRCGNHARLAHAAAQHLARLACAGNELGRAADDGAHWRG